MKNNRLIIILAMALLPLSAAAQTAGTMIHGVVRDDVEGLMGCNVVEIDESNRIVAHGTTDMNGNFSFRIVNPKHKLKISYVGYKTQEIPIRGTTYNILMEETGKIQEVVIKATKRTTPRSLKDSASPLWTKPSKAVSPVSTSCRILVTSVPARACVCVV